MPPHDEPITTVDTPASQPKWRICQNFAEVNKATQVPPLTQGNIRLKQQRLAGHRWISVICFASGVYAVPVSEESQPYTCFYVEGRGFFCYCRMPFGMTGSLSTFRDMTATALGNLVGIICKLFVDDTVWQVTTSRKNYHSCARSSTAYRNMVFQSPPKRLSYS